MAHLSFEQIALIDRAEPLIRAIEGELMPEMQTALARLQVACAENFAAGEWTLPGGKKIHGPRSPVPIPSIDETKRVLTAVEGFILDDSAHRLQLHQLIADLKLDEPHLGTSSAHSL